MEQGTGNGEPGMTVFYSGPFSALLSAILILSVPVLVLGFLFPVPDFNNIHVVLTQIQTVVCVSVSLQICDRLSFHYLC